MRALRRLATAWLHGLRSRIWTARGRRRLERGDLPAAIGALHMALRLKPSGFPALMLLARAYLRSRDFFRARGALAQARETDRARFESEAPRQVALEGYDLAGLSPQAPLTAPAVAVAAEHRRARPGVAGALPYGDCRDVDEYARFRAMPPIAPGEIDDWDSVLQDLLD
jgi:hypothetical protein